MCALPRRQYHDDLTAFRLGFLLDFGLLLKVALDAAEQLHAQFLVRHFAAPEAQGDFHLVAFFQESLHAAHFHIVIVIVDIGAQLDFLDLDNLLLLARFVLALLFLVLVLADIEDFANRRLRIRRDLHQVQARFVGFVDGGIPVDNPKIFTARANKANGQGVDLVVDARPILRGRRGRFDSSDVAFSFCC